MPTDYIDSPKFTAPHSLAQAARRLLRSDIKTVDQFKKEVYAWAQTPLQYINGPLTVSVTGDSGSAIICRGQTTDGSAPFTMETLDSAGTDYTAPPTLLDNDRRSKALHKKPSGASNTAGTNISYISGITPGTATALKALVLDASKGIGTITSATITTINGTTGTITTVNATTGNITTVNATTVAASGKISSTSSSAGVGYSTGAGGTVTQTPNKTSSVTINKICGKITTDAAALAADTAVTFTVNNNTVASTDVIVVNHDSGGTPGNYSIAVSSVSAGSFTITLANDTAGSLSQAIEISFIVLKAVTS